MTTDNTLRISDALELTEIQDDDEFAVIKADGTVDNDADTAPSSSQNDDFKNRNAKARSIKDYVTEPVRTDDTIDGDGVTSDLSVAEPYSAQERGKLSGIETGAQVNVGEEFTQPEKSKLANIEDNATADQTAAEIKAAYESNANTNAFTDDDEAKLNAIADGAQVNVGVEYTPEMRAKLAGIENDATADQTDAEIKAAYERNADTNAFTDAEKRKLGTVAQGAQVNVKPNWIAPQGDESEILNKPVIPTVPGRVTTTTDGQMSAADKAKLDRIENNATADQTPAEIEAAYESRPNTNKYTTNEKTKLGGIEDNADVTDRENVFRHVSDIVRGGANITANVDPQDQIVTLDGEAGGGSGGLSQVASDSSLKGTGTATDRLGVADGGVDTEQLADDAVTVDKLDTDNDGTNTQILERTATGMKWSPKPTGGGTSGITAVVSDDTLTGDGTTGSALSVANPFTNADKTKLDSIEAKAQVNVGEEFTAAEKTKLGDIENNATADQTADEIRALLGGIVSETQVVTGVSYDSATRVLTFNLKNPQTGAALTDVTVTLPTGGSSTPADGVVTAASLGANNVLTLTRSAGAAVTVDLSALANGDLVTRLNAIEANDWVTNARIADNAVDTDQIAQDAVTGREVKAGSIGGGRNQHIIADSIGEVSLDSDVRNQLHTKEEINTIISNNDDVGIDTQARNAISSLALPNAPQHQSEAKKYELQVPADSGANTWVEAAEGGETVAGDGSLVYRLLISYDSAGITSLNSTPYTIVPQTGETVLHFVVDSARRNWNQHIDVPIVELTTASKVYGGDSSANAPRVTLNMNASGQPVITNASNIDGMMVYLVKTRGEKGEKGDTETGTVTSNATLSGTGASDSPLGIADGGVGTEQLAKDAVETNNIADKAVGVDELKNESVSYPKLHVDVRNQINENRDKLVDMEYHTHDEWADSSDVNDAALSVTNAPLGNINAIAALDYVVSQTITGSPVNLYEIQVRAPEDVDPIRLRVIRTRGGVETIFHGGFIYNGILAGKSYYQATHDGLSGFNIAAGDVYRVQISAPEVDGTIYNGQVPAIDELRTEVRQEAQPHQVTSLAPGAPSGLYNLTVDSVIPAEEQFFNFRPVSSGLFTGVSRGNVGGQPPALGTASELPEKSGVFAIYAQAVDNSLLADITIRVLMLKSLGTPSAIHLSTNTSANPGDNTVIPLVRVTGDDITIGRDVYTLWTTATQYPDDAWNNQKWRNIAAHMDGMISVGIHFGTGGAVEYLKSDGTKAKPVTTKAGLYYKTADGDYELVTLGVPDAPEKEGTYQLDVDKDGDATWNEAEAASGGGSNVVVKAVTTGQPITHDSVNDLELRGTRTNFTVSSAQNQVYASLIGGRLTEGSSVTILIQRINPTTNQILANVESVAVSTGDVVVMNNIETPGAGVHTYRATIRGTRLSLNVRGGLILRLEEIA